MYNILLYFVHILEKFDRIGPEQAIGCMYRKINMIIVLTMELNITKGRR